MRSSHFIVSLIICLASFVAVFGQSETVSKADKDALADLSARIKKAIDAKDGKSLEQLYSVEFIHIHAIGKIDNRSARIAALLLGEPTIDSKSVEGFNLRKYGTTIIATGKVVVTNDSGDPVVYAVTRVFSKTGTKWLLVSSHASRVGE